MSQESAMYTPENRTTAEEQFKNSHPTYAETTILDELRATDYYRLDEHQQVYLDYTGGGIYAQSQIDAHMKMLQNGVWGNPHSQNPTSLAMTERVEQARDYVLKYFRASADEYAVIFTPNASGALKLVGESYPFSPGSIYLPIYDNHNSVNGIREFARAKGAAVHYVPTHLPELRIDETELMEQLSRANPAQHNLFAFPAQSNFTGVQHDLKWIEKAQKCGWHVLLDAAAYAPTNRLDLCVWHPDFVSLSFYKIFGYPTGIGCLIARKEALAQLRRPWFAGGTITITSVQGEGWHYLIDGHAAFEDGTVNYLSIPAVEIGLRHIESIGIERIHERVSCLSDWLLSQMPGLKHSNGESVVEIYGPLTAEKRGGTITFNLNDPEGKRFNYQRVEKLANEANISLRTGCFCNPGSGEIAHHLSQQELAPLFALPEAISFHEFIDVVADSYAKYPSSIRVSVGLVSNFADVYTLMAFLERFRDQSAVTINELPITIGASPDTA